MSAPAINVAIIGAGPLGLWLASRAAEAGCVVLLEDVMPLNLRHAQDELRDRLNAATLPRVSFVATLEDALTSADIAIDCVPDELESKLEIFCLMDRMAPPRTLFLTPTTKLSIADLASCTYRADKCLAFTRNSDWLTEPVITDNLELPLVATTKTAPETITQAENFWRALGFTPSVSLDPIEPTLR